MLLNIKLYHKIFIPIITSYLLLISYHSNKILYYFNFDACQLVLIALIFIIYLKAPPYGWLFAVLFIITYKFNKEIPIVKETFAQQFSSPDVPTETDIKDKLKQELTEQESRVIQNILKKYQDDINFLLEEDIEVIKKYGCTTHPDGVGLPSPVKEYDINKTINFDI
jgi:hypothetical protein